MTSSLRWVVLVAALTVGACSEDGQPAPEPAPTAAEPTPSATRPEPPATEPETHQERLRALMPSILMLFQAVLEAAEGETGCAGKVAAIKVVIDGAPALVDRIAAMRRWQLTDAERKAAGTFVPSVGPGGTRFAAAIEGCERDPELEAQLARISTK